MTVGRLAAAALAGVVLGAAVLGGPPGDRERYLDLVQRKQRADRLAALYKIEADLSAKKAAYVVLDLSDKKVYFKVKGRAFKAIPLTGLEVVRRSRPVEPEDLAGRAFILQIKEGKGVTTETIQQKQLTPDEVKAAGGKEVVDDAAAPGAEQGDVVEGAVTSGKTAGTGHAPSTQKVAGVAGGEIPPDPPARYHMGFDNGLSIWVVADAAPDPDARTYGAFLAFARKLGRLFGEGNEDSGETRITLHLTLDRGQQIFRQILCGQRFLIVP